jgi:hypothetical protein
LLSDGLAICFVLVTCWSRSRQSTAAPLRRRAVRLESSQELPRARPELRQAQIALQEEQVSVSRQQAG